MEPQTARGDQLFVQRLANKGVRKAVLDRARPRIFLEYARAHSLFERGGQRVLVERRHTLEYHQVEVATDHRSGRQQICRRTQTRQALADDVAQPFGETTEHLRTLCVGPPASFRPWHACISQKARHFAHEERIALRPLVHSFGNAQACMRNTEADQQVLHLGGRQTFELHPPELRGAPQLGERGSQRMGTVDLDIAIGPNDQQPAAGQLS